MPNYPYTFQLPPLNVQDIPNDGVAGEFLGINGSGVLDWLTAGGAGDMLKADNLSGLASYPTARTNLGLGTGDSPTFANLTLTSPSLSSSAPVTISQTWNNAAVAFTGLKVNAAGTSGTNSAAGSLLLDLQVGGVSKFKVDKDGTVTIGAGIIKDWGSGQLGIGAGGSVLYVSSAAVSCTNQFAIGASFGIPTVFIARDADNTLALRNGGNPQTFNVYGTYTSITDYRRLTVSCDNTTGNATITANKGSATTGDVGTVSINGVPVGLGKGNVSSNVAIGAGSLNANTTGSNNLALGANTLFLSTTATFNSALGENALRETTTGSFNVALGASAMQLNSTGASNTAVGVTAGAYAFNGGTSINNTTSSFSLFLGRDTKPDNIGQTNQIVIGYLANGIGSNSVVLGNDSITKTALKGNVGIGTTSPTSKLHVAGDVTLPSGGSIFFGGGFSIYGTTSATTINGPTAFGQVPIAVNGVTKWVFNYDGLFCGGGTTAAFPALKRSSTTIQARLADDTAFAPIQGKLTTDTAYTATVVAATGYITIYDSIGTAYRVPCAV